jgi:hypothetical protein
MRLQPVPRDRTEHFSAMELYQEGTWSGFAYKLQFEDEGWKLALVNLRPDIDGSSWLATVEVYMRVHNRNAATAQGPSFLETYRFTADGQLIYVSGHPSHVSPTGKARLSIFKLYPDFPKTP